jgi:Uma2 family endonuclease
MGVPKPKERYTIAQYVELEHLATQKHEYHDGEILAMSGGSFEHSLITTNTVSALHAALRGKPCRVLDSNLRVATPTRFFYPDATVLCGPPEFDPRDPSGQSVTNPRVVIGVLSPRTEAYDRGDKFAQYRQLGSLQEYVLISQFCASVEVFLRRESGAWLLHPYEGMGAVALLQSVGLEILLREIYAGVTFRDAPPPPPGSEVIVEPIERSNQ